MQNLLISNIELRTDDSIDVVKYTFTKNIELVVVEPSDHMIKIKHQYLEVCIRALSNE